jgi:hypothetical protein
MPFTRSDWRLIVAAFVAAVATGITHYAKLGGDIAPFIVAAAFWWG